jgi:23S rRNA (uridine2552-2'-O)-methyltransferase
MTDEKNTSGRGQRELRIRVKSAKGRKLSSTLWLERQLNDPYVIRAKKEGYRGRAAYKILELDDKYEFLKPGARVVDLGCAPGGWCQVAVKRVNALGENPRKPMGTVLGVDLQAIEPISGAQIHQLDFLSDEADTLVKGWLGGGADVVMSDMAASASGHKGTDHLRIIGLVEAALDFAFDVLDENGTFVAKVLAGGAELEMLTLLKKNFRKVANVKPPARQKAPNQAPLLNIRSVSGFNRAKRGSGRNPYGRSSSANSFQRHQMHKPPQLWSFARQSAISNANRQLVRACAASLSPHRVN